MRAMSQLRKDADIIINEAIQAVLPDAAVKKALADEEFPGSVYLVSVGKAAWQMAKSAAEVMQDRLSGGIVVTKYGHVKHPLDKIACYEAGHPVPDENSFSATRKVLDYVEKLKETDTVLFLLSGGGSALFEMPLIPGGELQNITRQLLACGADIVQINTIRKRLSAVKGGRFAQACYPAKVYSVVLSDIIGDSLDMIASGPAYPDSSTCGQAMEIVNKYDLKLSEQALACLQQETPKVCPNVTTRITGSVRELCMAAAESCRRLGYEPQILTDSLDCEAKDAGRELAFVLQKHRGTKTPLAFIAGGETVVTLTGNCKGGRNQELALSAAPILADLPGAALFSIGSDGTDGPTDAAGGYVDSSTQNILQQQGVDIHQVLQNNDAYHALQKCNGLIITGPTGTNVNDVAVALLLPEQ